MLRSTVCTVIVVCLALLASHPARADAAPPSSAAPASVAEPPAPSPDVAAASDGWGIFEPTLDLRARMEFGDQEGRDEAVAWTLRGRLGLRATLAESLSAFGEVEYTRTVKRQGYQAASVHGLGENKVVIADPESLELNQLWLGYEGSDASAKAGIQRIIVGNSRFIGNVGWRQNEQTFDGVTLGYTGVEGLDVRYGYFYNVRRIFGTETRRAAGQRDFDSRSHYATASYSVAPALEITGYGYFLDLENAAGSSESSNTLGASLTGKVPIPALGSEGSLAYRLELATQSDAADSPLDYRASYLHATADTKVGPFDVGLGYEVLGAGDGVGFSTPLATLHKFNGFADTFLTTPGLGLRDFYVSLGSKLPLGFSAQVIYHDFTAEDDSTDLGYEVDVVIAKALPLGLKFMLKAALYNAEEGAFRDTERLIVQLEYAY